jgi:hypothetical protein
MDVRMPFRVDDIRRGPPNRWEFDLMGLYGWPCFAVLQTDETGHGLTTDETYIENLVLWEVVMPPSRRQILGKSNFEIPEHSEEREALQILTVALTSLGWGNGSTDRHLLRRIANE